MDPDPHGPPDLRGACDPALSWVAEQPDQRPSALWATCPHGDWLAWYLGALGARAGQGSPQHRTAVLVACLCARTAGSFAGEWREEIDRLLGRVEAWAHGEDGDLGPVLARLWEIRADAAADVAASLSVHRHAVTGPLSTLTADGKLKRVEHGVYRLARRLARRAA